MWNVDTVYWFLAIMRIYSYIYLQYLHPLLLPMLPTFFNTSVITLQAQ